MDPSCELSVSASALGPCGRTGFDATFFPGTTGTGILAAGSWHCPSVVEHSAGPIMNAEIKKKLTGAGGAIAIIVTANALSKVFDWGWVFY
jgi:hypothetical protein